MADLKSSHPPPPHEESSPEPHSEGQSGETNLSLALKALFWFILVPAAVVLTAKWLLQP
jgi:hypothetical protein